MVGVGPEAKVLPATGCSSPAKARARGSRASASPSKGYVRNESIQSLLGRTITSKANAQAFPKKGGPVGQHGSTDWFRAGCTSAWRRRNALIRRKWGQEATKSSLLNSHEPLA